MIEHELPIISAVTATKNTNRDVILLEVRYTAYHESPDQHELLMKSDLVSMIRQGKVVINKSWR